MKEQQDYLLYLSSEYLLDIYEKSGSGDSFTKEIPKISKNVFIFLLEYLKEKKYETELAFNAVFTAIKIKLDLDTVKELKKEFKYLEIKILEKE